VPLTGIDGCRAGWLCVVEHDSQIEAAVVATLRPWLETVRPHPAVIDMPLGFSESGPRRCDTLARAALRPSRSSSLFPAPVRGALHLPTYAATCAAHRAIDGRALSKQTWFLLPRIREVDALLQSAPAWRPVLYEGHPELSFATWHDAVPMPHAKKTDEGRAARASLIESCWPGALGEARATLPRGGWAEDDLLDAFALLWTARRIAAGEAQWRPDPLEVDATGIRMAIVA
jgi:predicted RNase H-like nuclease